MPELFSILIKINVALVLFCAGYYLVLRKLTFYTLNRVYLVGTIIFSSVYPFVDLNAFAQKHQQIVEPVQNMVTYWKAPVTQIVEKATYWNWLSAIFWIGAAVFACRLITQMLSLYKIYKHSKGSIINGQPVRVVSGDISPFSFWQSIYINPENLSDTDVKNILEHEQVHVKEWHTLDILLAEISVIFYWFNPGVWMMKRAVRENIEFITDRKILQKGTDSKAYQYSLLNVTFNQPAPAITSNFNFSTLKKRIIMMNAKRSSNLNLTRYALLVPVVTVCLLSLTLAKAEVIKINKVFKQIAVTVESIKPAILNADTTPVKKTTPAKKAAPAKRAEIAKPTDTKEAVVTDTKEVVVTGYGRQEPDIRIRNFNGDSIVYVLNGKIATAQDFNKLNFNDVESINVIKEDASAFLNKLTGMSNHKANGVIVVTLKGGDKGAVKLADRIRGTIQFDTYGNGTIVPTDSTTVTRWRGITGKAKEPLIVLDGLILAEGQDAMNKIPADVIESISVLKDGSATGLYGEKAKDGVIIIKTRRAK